MDAIKPNFSKLLEWTSTYGKKLGYSLTWIGSNLWGVQRELWPLSKEDIGLLKTANAGPLDDELFEKVTKEQGVTKKWTPSEWLFAPKGTDILLRRYEDAEGNTLFIQEVLFQLLGQPGALEERAPRSDPETPNGVCTPDSMIIIMPFKHQGTDL